MLRRDRPRGSPEPSFRLLLVYEPVRASVALHVVRPNFLTPKYKCHVDVFDSPAGRSRRDATIGVVVVGISANPRTLSGAADMFRSNRLVLSLSLPVSLFSLFSRARYDPRRCATNRSSRCQVHANECPRRRNDLAVRFDDDDDEHLRKRASRELSHARTPAEDRFAYRARLGQGVAI